MNQLRKVEIVSVQYLRAIAAIMIVLFHIPFIHKVPGVHVNGDSHVLNAGVDIFFVVSGFIMWYTTRGRKLSPYRFMLNRLLRIVPLYWIVTILMLTILLLKPDLLKSSTFNSFHILSSFFFLPWPHPVFSSEIWPLVIPGWSLNYEIFFYIIFCFSLSMTTGQSLVYQCTVFGAILLSASFSGNYTIREFYGDAIILEFLLGVLLGALVTNGYRLSARKSLFLLAASIFLIFASSLWHWPRFFQWGIPACGIVAGVVFYELSHKVPQVKWLKTLGDASYSIYLLHGMLIALMVKLSSSVGFENAISLSDRIMLTSMLIFLSCAVGVLSFFLIEKPLHSFLKKRFL
jgi:exopolysaccharide production protein ExoZ